MKVRLKRRKTMEPKTVVSRLFRNEISEVDEEKRTEEELLPWREHVHAESDLELVLLEAQPLAERSKNSHCIKLKECLFSVISNPDVRRRRVAARCRLIV
jgi:hypothetical protein